MATGNDGAEANDGQQVDPLLKGCGLGCLGLVVVFVGIVLIGSLFGDTSDDSDSLGYEAESVCEGFIKDRLKAPSTADFDLSHAGQGNDYTVSGTVDAENSFGAKLRMDVTCEVRLDGSTWRLASLSGID